MNDLKQIAPDAVPFAWRDSARTMCAYAAGYNAALDALAAQEPAMVAACCGRTECGGECGNEWQGMQPSPPQPAVPEEFEKALKEARDLADQHWQPGKYKDEAFAKLARLYALASDAPQRMTVSREALLEAFMIYADPQMVRVTYSVEKLRALGIEVKE